MKKRNRESDDRIRFPIEQLIEILIGAFVKRGIEHSSLDIPTESEHHGKLYTKEIKLKQGIETEMAKKSLN